MVRYFVTSIVVAVLLTGCAGSGGNDETDRSDGAVATATPQTSPLETALGFASEPSRRQYQLISLQRQADVSIVQCMKQAGFFYAVRPAEDAFRSGAFVGDGSREWTALNGLGITSSFADALATEATEIVRDPTATNLDYVASLTAEQAAAYDEALVGPFEGATATAVEYQPGGCWGAAYTDILRLVAILDEFEPQLEALNSRLNSDPRVLAFQQGWSSCMEPKGHRYANETALVDDVYARLLDIELVEQDGLTRVVSLEAIEQLATFEHEAGLASYDCRLGFADELALLRFDYEQEFLDDNRFRIAELLPPGP